MEFYLIHLYRLLFSQASDFDGEDVSIASSDDDMPQTLMEIDYETVIDDDSVDEFNAFKGVLEGTYKYLVVRHRKKGP